MKRFAVLFLVLLGLGAIGAPTVSILPTTGAFTVGPTAPGTEATLEEIKAILGTTGIAVPAGAATAAKQPALGTAGTPSADVISVQGVTSMTPLKVDLATRLDATNDGVTATPLSVTTTMQNAATATGSGTVIATTGMSALALQVTISATATVTFEGTTDGATWIAIGFLPDGTGASPQSTAINVAMNNIYRKSISGLVQVRARISSYGSGTVTVVGHATSGGVAAQSTLSTASGIQRLTLTGSGSDAFSNVESFFPGNGSDFTGHLGVHHYQYNGSGWDRVRAATTFKDLAAVAIGSITTVWTPTSAKKFRLMGGTFSVDAAVSVLFEDNAGGTTIFRTPVLEANKPYNLPTLGNGRLSAAANNVLKATASGAANITGTLFGTEE